MYKTKLDKTTLIDKILGTIYGNALGDAVGLATEFLNKKQAKTFFGDGSKIIEFPTDKKTLHSIRWKNGDWTDDTDQMILIMQSLIANKLKVDRLDFAKRLYVWMCKGFPELGDQGGMGIGQTVLSVLTHPQYLVNPHQAATDVWEKGNKQVAPNGAVMRTSILGVLDFDNLDKVIANTIEICKVTHADTRCIASCVAVTTAIALMLQGKYETKDGLDVAAVLKEAKSHALKYLDKAYEKEFEKYINAKTPQEMELDEPSSIGYTLKCMGSGFYGLQSKNEFDRTISDLVMEAGDADTNAAVCGAIVGCKLGYKKLPKNWLAALPFKKWLDNIVIEFCALIGLDRKDVTAALDGKTETKVVQKKIAVPVFDPSTGISGFAVSPKMDCPHVKSEIHKDILSMVTVDKPCKECSDNVENWMCLACGAIYCSRYRNSHMKKHNNETKHPIAVSFTDLSVWCYSCDSYIEDPSLNPILKAFRDKKFKYEK